MSKEKLIDAARWAFNAWDTGSAEEQNEAFKGLSRLLLDIEKAAQEPEQIPVAPIQLVVVDGDKIHEAMADADPTELLVDSEVDEFQKFLHTRAWHVVGDSGFWDQVEDYIRGEYADFKKAQKAEADNG